MEKIKQLGFVLQHLAPSQLSFYLLTQINQFLENSNDYDFVIFQTHLMPPTIIPNCMCLNSTEIWSFDGTLITTDLDNADSCCKATNNARNILYLWDLEWKRGNNNYLRNLSILRHPRLELAARSEDHARVIRNYANKDVKVIENANIKEFISWT